MIAGLFLAAATAFPVLIVQIEGHDPRHHVSRGRDAKDAFVAIFFFADDGISTGQFHTSRPGASRTCGLDGSEEIFHRVRIVPR